jgi:hypothetical protein
MRVRAGQAVTPERPAGDAAGRAVSEARP